ncbi:MAG: hypothetical protein HZB13_03695 [Acidobacteria bacterium]|nr:hypothetical protein [Acidobacteriota bacterium]
MTALLASIAVSLLAAQPAPTAGDLMARMREAEVKNRQQAAMFVYREDIRHTETLSDGRVLMRDWVTYEVSMLEGEPYHRRVAIQGEELTEKEQALEEKRYRAVERYRQKTSLEDRRRKHNAEEENRFKIDTRVVLEHHTMRLLGEETVNGMKVWVVETQPRPGTRKPKRRAEWSLSQRLKYWIDQRSSLPIQLEAEQLYDFDTARKGTLTQVSFIWLEGVNLPERIVSAGSRKFGQQSVRYETEQRYSGYQRFGARSVLVWEESAREQ